MNEGKQRAGSHLPDGVREIAKDESNCADAVCTIAEGFIGR